MLLLAAFQHIAGAANRMQDRLVETLLDLAAQPRDMDVDDVGLRIEMIVPDILEQHGARHHLAGMAHQIFEQAEFARLQRDLACCAADRMRQPVEFEIADTVDGFGFLGAGAPVQDLDALKDVDAKIGVGIGVVDVKVNHIETADEVAARIETAEKILGKDRVKWIHPDCGFWMLKRSVADRKMAALTAGRDKYLGR